MAYCGKLLCLQDPKGLIKHVHVNDSLGKRAGTKQFSATIFFVVYFNMYCQSKNKGVKIK